MQSGGELRVVAIHCACTVISSIASGIHKCGSRSQLEFAVSGAVAAHDKTTVPPA